MARQSRGTARHDKSTTWRAMARHGTTNLWHGTARLVHNKFRTKRLWVHPAFTALTNTVAFMNRAAFTNSAAPRSRAQPRSRTRTLRSRCVHVYALRSLCSHCVLHSHFVHCVHGPCVHQKPCSRATRLLIGLLCIFFWADHLGLHCLGIVDDLPGPLITIWHIVWCSMCSLEYR